MAEENKVLTPEEIDSQIKKLQELKKTLVPQSSYDARPVLNKLGYDLQPMKLLTSFIKTALVLLFLAGCIYGYGWWRGKQGVQPILDWHGKEEWVQLNEHYLHILKDGTMEVVDSDKKTVIKKITVKDLENLKKNLRPYGFQMKPFVTAGGSLGEKTKGFEAGAGIDFFKWYKTNANAFLTNLGAYLGVGYNITDNFDIMLGAGKGWKGDNRIGLFGKWKF
jgi:hypothetical protein